MICKKWWWHCLPPCHLWAHRSMAERVADVAESEQNSFNETKLFGRWRANWCWNENKLPPWHCQLLPPKTLGHTKSRVLVQHWAEFPPPTKYISKIQVQKCNTAAFHKHICQVNKWILKFSYQFTRFKLDVRYHWLQEQISHLLVLNWKALYGKKLL